jgi:hypothetical protein
MIDGKMKKYVISVSAHNVEDQYKPIGHTLSERSDKRLNALVLFKKSQSPCLFGATSKLHHP